MDLGTSKRILVIAFLLACASPGTAEVRSGSYIGTGAARSLTGLGLQPDVVIVKGDNNTIRAVMRTATMAGVTKPMTSAVAAAANLITSLDPDGFSVSADIQVNGPGTPYHWIAFEAVAGELALGTYTGNAGIQSVTGLGFAPAYVVVLPADARPAYQRSGPMPAGISFDFDNSSGDSNRILALLADGFQVGNDADVNDSGLIYHYVAWKAAPGRMAVGSYLGDASDDRLIGGVGFPPEYVVVKRHGASGATHKPASMGVSLDQSMLFNLSNFQVDAIQTLGADGFQVGTQPRVNASGDTFYWMAFGPHQTFYRSIGTTPDLVDQGTITLTAGSSVVTKVGGASWTAANRGRGDRLTVGGNHYMILSVDSNSQLTLATPALAGFTGSTYTIARQFTTLQGWEDCVSRSAANTCKRPADTQEYFATSTASLVADNRNEVGIAYDDSPFLLADDVFIQGSTTDTTHTILLTVDPGHRHDGVPGTGVVVDAQGGPHEFSIQDSHVTVEWLEFRGCRGAIGLNAVEIRADGGDVATGVLLQNLLVHDFDDPIAGHDSSGIALSGDLTGLKGATIRNVMIWDGDSYGIEGDNAADSMLIENVSIDGMLNAGIWAGNSEFTVRNAIVTGSLTADYARDTSGSFLGSHNTDSDGSGAAFFGITLTASASAIFAGPGADLHLKPGLNDQVNSGQDLSTSFLNDVDGQSRPALTWDRGADERDAPVTATADLAVQKDDGVSTSVPGDVVTYSITVTNDGPDTLDSLKVLDPTPSLAGVAFAPSVGSYDGASGWWTGLSLGASQSVVLGLSGAVDAFARGSLVNTVTVSPPPGVSDPDVSDDSAGDTNTLTPAVDVQLTKLDDVDPVPLGGLVTYTLTVANAGPSGATGVTLSDPLPPGVELDAAAGAIVTSQGGCSYDAPTRTVGCALGALAPAAVATVTIKVRGQAVGTFTNTATTSRAETDTVAGNDAASQPTTVEISSLGVTVLTATSRSQQNVLEWINPVSAEYVSTEIVVRGDRFPTAPGDGATIYLSGAGGSGGRVQFTHATGALSNGTTFYYGVFVHRSAAPVLSPGRFVTGRPFDTAGPVKWAFSTGASAMTPPTVGGAGVIAPSNDGKLYAMRRGAAAPGGEWPASFEPMDVGVVQGRSPVVPIVANPNPVVYLGSQNGSLYAIDAAEGGSAPVLWTYSYPAAGGMLQAAPSGIFGEFGGTLDYVVMGTRNGAAPNAYVALDPVTGVDVEVFDNGGAGPGELGIVTGTPAIEYGPPVYAYFTGYERTPGGSTLTLRAFELKASPDPVFNLAWGRALGNIDSSPVVRDGRVYVSSPLGVPPGTLYSIDALDGNNTLLDRTFAHNDGQVRGFVWPDRLSGDLYFATDRFVWGVTDTGAALVSKFPAISLGASVTPSAVLFTPGGHYLYVGGSDGKLYEIDVQPAIPVVKSVTLGDGAARVGAPSLDRGVVPNLVHVGSEAGIFYAVQVPLP